MSKLGSKQKPAVIRVKTQERANELLGICNENGWQVIIGVEPYKDEDISDVERLMGLAGGNIKTVTNPEKVGRNDPCPCGSGKKFKKCCGA
jgi:SWIM/SEC-C metal-binding protein